MDVILIGAGNRGREVYGQYIRKHPHLFRIVGIAEPIEERRRLCSEEHAIPKERQFASWEEMLSRPAFAGAAIITTQDQEHTAPTLAALAQGYDVLLEKPMAHLKEDCVKLVQAAQQSGKILQICHVLRYTEVMQKMKQILDSGTLGEIVTIEHRENVSYWHMAHSYVRGNWRRKEFSSPMILAKCCHDLDLIYWLSGQKCLSLSSVGSLRHFRPDKAPRGAPERCTDGCPVERECPYEARSIYLDGEPILHELRRTGPWAFRLAIAFYEAFWKYRNSPLLQIFPPWKTVSRYHGWPRSVVTQTPGYDALLHALQVGPYGRCVYQCDNDVVDHQVVTMELAGGISATLTMHGHAHEGTRTMRWEGSDATLFATLGSLSSEIIVHHHRTGARKRYPFYHGIGKVHAGGDEGVMEGFHKALLQRKNAPLTSASDSLESHLMAFAAEDARLSQTVINMQEYRR